MSKNDAVQKARTAKGAHAERKRAQPVTVTDTARRGRPPGKRSNPDFEQVTIYIRKKTHQDAKITLLKSGERQEFSELIEALLGDWLGG